jgi:hypothetical protein
LAGTEGRGIQLPGSSARGQSMATPDHHISKERLRTQCRTGTTEPIMTELSAHGITGTAHWTSGSQRQRVRHAGGTYPEEQICHKHRQNTGILSQKRDDSGPGSQHASGEPAVIREHRALSQNPVTRLALCSCLLDRPHETGPPIVDRDRPPCQYLGFTSWGVVAILSYLASTGWQPRIWGAG